ncbi:MAG: DNA-directed RNA polymerase subunit omega [Armatimonadota bacterium]
MRGPTISELETKVPSKFSLVVAAAKRARQLNAGATPLVECDSKHPLTIALYEIAEGKIEVEEVEAEPDED